MIRSDPDPQNMFSSNILLLFSDQRLPHQTAGPRKDNASVHVFILCVKLHHSGVKGKRSSLSCQILLFYILHFQSRRQLLKIMQLIYIVPV
jgi:hypothetical protein